MNNNETAVLDWRGRILGWIIDQGDGSLVATDFYGRLLAIYKDGETCTWNGRRVGSGNLLSALILNPDMVNL